VVQGPRSENPSAEFTILAIGCGFPRYWAEMEKGMLRGRIPLSCFGPRSNPKGGCSQKSEMMLKDSFFAWRKPVPELLTPKSHPRFRSPKGDSPFTWSPPLGSCAEISVVYSLHKYVLLYELNLSLYSFLLIFLALPKFHMKQHIFPDLPISLFSLLSRKSQFHLFLSGNMQLSSEGEENFICSTRLR
jgi:hypothetical protein